MLADSGFWTIANLTQIPGEPELLIPPARHGRQGKPRKDGKPSESKSDGLRAAMTARLQSEDGKARYALRKQTVEPVFGQVKDVRGARRFQRRGLGACQAGVEAVVRHPRPAQAVAPSDCSATWYDGHHLSREQAQQVRRGWATSTALLHGLPRFARPPATYPGRL